jgi:hypothetical protein
VSVRATLEHCGDHTITQLAEGKSKEKSLRIPTASELIPYTPLTTARAIAQYSPAILALIPLHIDVVYQATRLTSEAVLMSELWKGLGGVDVFGSCRRTSGMRSRVWSRIRSGEGSRMQKKGCPLTVS